VVQVLQIMLDVLDGFGGDVIHSTLTDGVQDSRVGELLSRKFAVLQSIFSLVLDQCEDGVHDKSARC